MKLVSVLELAAKEAGVAIGVVLIGPAAGFLITSVTAALKDLYGSVFGSGGKC